MSWDYGYIEPTLWMVADYSVNSLLPALLALGLGILLTRGVNAWSRRHTARLTAKETRPGTGFQSRVRYRYRKASTQIITYGVKAVIWIPSAMLALTGLGVPMRSLIPITTVLVASLGFGGRKIVQDLLGGFFAASEQQCAPGDDVTITLPAGTEVSGTVESITLRVLRLRTVSGEVVTVAHSEISALTNKSPHDWSQVVADIVVPVGANMTHAVAAILRAGQHMYQESSAAPMMMERPRLVGVIGQDDTSVTFQVTGRVQPGTQERVREILMLRVQAELARCEINGERDET